MFKVKSALLLLFVISICTLPPCVAKDVGKQGTSASVKEYANVVTPVIIVNAVCDNVVTAVITKKEAATHDVAILTKTPTVEVRAFTTVEGPAYQRLCGNALTVYKLNYNRNVTPLIHLHINPGLRGC